MGFLSDILLLPRVREIFWLGRASSGNILKCSRSLGYLSALDKGHPATSPSTIPSCLWALSSTVAPCSPPPRRASSSHSRLWDRCTGLSIPEEDQLYKLPYSPQIANNHCHFEMIFKYFLKKVLITEIIDVLEHICWRYCRSL